MKENIFMQNALSDADRYIEEHRHEVNPRYRQLFHAMPPINWMNDPNGFSYYHDRFHLFFQFYPYENKWGPMHWGHVSSLDLLHYEELPVALAPGNDESGGCFSGSAIPNPFGKDELLIYYTSHHEKDGITREETSLAISKDGIHFEKKGKVIDESMIPLGYSKSDFRDPKAYYEDGYLYLIMATNKDKEGCLLIYRGTSIDSFSFHMEIRLEEMDLQPECPDLIKMDDRYLLLFSSLHHGRKSTSSYALMNLDLGKKTYSLISSGPLDYGEDYYAPQAVKAKGKIYLTGWLESWKEHYDFIEMKEGWNSSLALPRELSLTGDKLILHPLSEFFLHLGEKKTMGPIREAGLLSFDLEKGESLILAKEEERSRVTIKRTEDELFITLYSDSEKILKAVPYLGGEIRLIMDKASLEFFLPQGIVASFAHYFKNEEISVIGRFTYQPYLP